ncbi:hypothetical protein F5Y17DRAFT_471633 [Xylariaceae sp. FL0594]|nr:hypothetical protein F5Y17DRAFT_471633 [Xylariaceae sp. FL0594]
MAPTEFHFYTKLPPELKLMIWEQAFRDLRDRPGVHRFTLSVLKNRDEIGLVPSRGPADDPSSWRHTPDLASVDEFSRHVFSRKTLIIRKNAHYDSRRARKNNGAGYKTHKGDLFYLNLNFGASMVEFIRLNGNVSAHMTRFSGITRIALNTFHIARGYNFCAFLDWFVDLKAVYFITPVRWGCLGDVYQNLPAHNRYQTAFDDQEELAYLSGLDVFQDKRMRFCEISESVTSDSSLVGAVPSLFQLARDVALEWTRYSTRYNPIGRGRLGRLYPRKPVEVKILLTQRRKDYLWAQY